jgi:hypothetical protein
MPNIKEQPKNININEIDIDKLQFILKDTEPIHESPKINPSELNKIFSGEDSKHKEGNLFDSGIFGESIPSNTQTNKKDIFEFPKSANTTNTPNVTNDIFNSNIFNQSSEPVNETKKETPLDSGFFSQYQNMFTANPTVTNNPPKTEPVNINIQSSKPIDLVSINLDIDTMNEKLDKILKDWSYHGSEKKNLRMLLASLNEVWTADETWQEVSMKRLIEDEKYLSVYCYLI